MISPESEGDTFIEEIEIINSNTMQQVQQPKYTGAIPKNSSPPSALMKPKVDHLPHNFQSVVDKINKGYRVVILLRGLPGSGKSFLSYQLIEQTVKTVPDDHIVSADKFFINNRGQYQFQPQRISEAHEYAQQQFVRRASMGVSPLIVDNTNLAAWEMYYYLQVASQYGYHVEIMEPNTPWKTSSALLAKKNQHSVPKEKIDQMKAKYEAGTVEILMKSLNLHVVQEPKMRNVPPLPAVKVTPEVPKPAPAIKIPTYNLPAAVSDATDSPLPKSSSSSSQQETVSIESQIFDKWEASERAKKEEVKEVQKKQRKNKSPLIKFSSHRKDCPNENQSFAIIRNMYPTCRDSYLWDFFVRCNGDADWCVNLLFDENLTDQMDSGSDLNCVCFGNDVTKPASVKKEVQQSPTVKSKKAKTEAAKQINVDEWLETKEAIEKSIQIGNEHFPEHVNMVRNWKNPQKAPPIVEAERPVTPKPTIPTEICEEFHELTISKQLILELDEDYGGGLLKCLLEQQTKLPPKIFIRKSTAYQLYLEIMEAFYAHEEETKLNMMKTDEEFAKLLSEEDKQNVPKKPEPAAWPQQSVWSGEGDSTDDFALKMSKEKLVQLFPGLNKNDLMEIFAGSNYNFEDTCSLIQDSLFCTPDERKQIAASKKKVFNTPWRGEDPKKVEAPVKKGEVNEGYTSEHLKTVDDLRQAIFDHQDEQKVCRRKAQEAIQKKQYELATYMSNIASFHKQMESEATHEVANLMAGIHEQVQGSSTTLDLHYLNLVEAACLLDTFLDKQIERLRTIRKPSQELFIITGRGAHSANGMANIKIKTKSRLQERNLSCMEHNNPGLLKVKVYQQSFLSNEM